VRHARVLVWTTSRLCVHIARTQAHADRCAGVRAYVRARAGTSKSRISTYGFSPRRDGARRRCDFYRIYPLTWHPPLIRRRARARHRGEFDWNAISISLRVDGEKPAISSQRGNLDENWKISGNVPTQTDDEVSGGVIFKEESWRNRAGSRGTCRREMKLVSRDFHGAIRGTRIFLDSKTRSKCRSSRYTVIDGDAIPSRGRTSRTEDGKHSETREKRARG